MKKVAVLWCFIPWIVYVLLRVVDFIEGGNVALEVFPLTWIAVSPFVTGIVLWFANEEGYRSGTSEAQQ